MPGYLGLLKGLKLADLAPEVCKRALLRSAYICTLITMVN
jgi:hypothetical protein